MALPGVEAASLVC